MLIVNEPLLVPHRLPGACELCGRWCVQREPHHIFAKGFGGGSRLDIPINLLGVGAAFMCNCHGKIHGSHIKRDECIDAVAEREALTFAYVEETLLRLHNRTRNKLCVCSPDDRVQVGREAFICGGCGMGA